MNHFFSLHGDYAPDGACRTITVDSPNIDLEVLGQIVRVLYFAGQHLVTPQAADAARLDDPVGACW